MNRKMLFKKIRVVALTASFGLVACGDDTPSSVVVESSSSVVAKSSSSESIPGSSQSTDGCVHMPHFEESEQVSYQIPVCSEEGTTAPDCETDDVYVCRNGFWRKVE